MLNITIKYSQTEPALAGAGPMQDLGAGPSEQ